MPSGIIVNKGSSYSLKYRLESCAGMVGSVYVFDCCGCLFSGVHHPIGRNQVNLGLNSSFLDYSSVRILSGANFFRGKQRKNRGFAVVDKLPGSGNQEDNFEDVKQQILDYFTYKAVRTVLNQLYEMNPVQYRWFYNYVASNERGFGKTFIRNLVKDEQELAERVMVTRLHLYQRWTKFCDHTKMYERISDQNLELMRERLIETVIWPSDDSNSEMVG